MQRDLLLIEEVIDAARQAHVLATGLDAEGLMADRLRRDALLGNFTVVGEAANQLPQYVGDLEVVLAELDG